MSLEAAIAAATIGEWKNDMMIIHTQFWPTDITGGLDAHANGVREALADLDAREDRTSVTIGNVTFNVAPIALNGYGTQMVAVTHIPYKYWYQPPF